MVTMTKSEETKKTNTCHIWVDRYIALVKSAARTATVSPTLNISSSGGLWLHNKKLSPMSTHVYIANL